jgi:GT2 family glycosyltransferase
MQIFILSFNHPMITERCIRSVLKHTSPSKISVIHNGSEIKNTLFLENQFPEINHIKIKSNKGFSGGANIALTSNRFCDDWICFLTNDCELEALPSTPFIPLIPFIPFIPLPGSPEFNSAETLFIAPLILFKNSLKVDSFGGYFIPTKAKLRHQKERTEISKILNYSDQGEIPYIPGSAFIIHRTLIQEVGLFDETLGTFWEDVDYSIRAFSKGFTLKADHTFRVRHSGGKSTKKNPYYTTYLYQRNRLIVSWRYCRNFKEKFLLCLTLFQQWSFTLLKLCVRRDFLRMRLLLKAFIHGWLTIFLKEWSATLFQQSGAHLFEKLRKTRTTE